MAYSPEQASEIKARICEEIASGKSLRFIISAEGMPAERTVFDWLANDSSFSQQYAHAREKQADFYADEIIEIADTETDASKARNRIAARQWKASKLVPKKYGDKLDLNHSGSITNMSEEQLNARLAELLRKAGISGDTGGSGPDQGEEQA